MDKYSRLFGLTALALSVGIAADARGGLIVLSSPVSALPATAGTGLVGNYYRPTGGVAVGSTTDAAAFVGSHSADATFVSTAINYPSGDYGTRKYSGDNTPVSTYLGSDAKSLVATNPANQTTSQILANTLDNTIYHFTGYLAITSAQVNTVHTFFLGVDDGASLTIGGTSVVDTLTRQQFGFSNGGNTVEFTKAGLYAIDVVYFEVTGGTGVQLGSTLTGSGAFGGLLTAANFYQTAATVVPEPSSLVLLALGGVVGLGFRSWRRAGQA